MRAKLVVGVPKSLGFGDIAAGKLFLAPSIPTAIVVVLVWIQ